MRSVFISHRAVSSAVGAAAMLFISSSVPGQVLNESQKLLPSDGAEHDAFGSSVSVSGDVAVVGAWLDDTFPNDTGSAYAFRWNGSSWVQEQKLLASDREGGGHFGTSVSVSGDVAVVGAGGNDDNGINSGSAYVFRWNGSSWEQEQQLLASDGAAFDGFGASVAVSGDVAVVGAWADDDACPLSVNCDSGSAYVFRWNGSVWEQEQKLLASDAAAGDFFGASVSVSGDVAVVGAFADNGNFLDSGSAYVFRWDGSVWEQEQKLLASDGAAEDRFGVSVSVSGDVAVVGAGLDDVTGGNSGDHGSAYVFRWNGSSWEQEQKLLASDVAMGANFGWSVSVSGDMAVVGAPRANVTGGNSGGSGSAYLYRWNGSSWVQEQKLLPSDGVANDLFGWSVSVSGDLAVVGATRDNDNGTDSGSAYVFELPSCGDGFVEGLEECDDGGGADGDGCSSTCSVESGYSCDASEPSICTDINECVLGTENCDINATCTNTPGSFTCTCNTGYSGDGVTCPNDNECVLGTHNCDVNATCTDTPGSFTCTCNTGYEGDGVTCVDDNECVLGTDNCDVNATCADTPGSFTCTCNAGYEGDGIVCTFIDLCISDPLLDCDDGQFCNGIETCTAAGCVPGQSPCNETETCYEDIDTCVSGAIPTVSAWGLLVLTLLLLAGAKIYFARRETATTP
jgi:cysteine-rich repeat protein